jgi:hypothetical protein
MLEQHFLQLTRLGAQANIFRIARPQLGREPEALVNLVETIL